MNLENAVVLVDGVSAWAKATLIWSGSTLQVLVANGTGGADIVETFSGVDQHRTSGRKHLFSSSGQLTDSDGDSFSEITAVVVRRCGSCGR